MLILKLNKVSPECQQRLLQNTEVVNRSLPSLENLMPCPDYHKQPFHSSNLWFQGNQVMHADITYLVLDQPHHLSPWRDGWPKQKHQVRSVFMELPQKKE